MNVAQYGEGNENPLQNVTGNVMLHLQNTRGETANLLQDSNESGIINLDIDELTPCLRRLSTGELVQTTVNRIDAQGTNFTGWYFGWSDEAKRNPMGVYGLYAGGDARLQGLVSIRAHSAGAEVVFVESAYYQKLTPKEYEGIGGHLFAEAVKRSREAGNPEGFVYFKAKTELIGYYQEKLGAVCGLGDQMGIYGQSARELFERYYGRWDEWRPGN